MSGERGLNKALVDELFSYRYDDTAHIQQCMREKMVPRVADGDAGLVRAVRSISYWREYVSRGIGRVRWVNNAALDEEIYCMSVWALGTLHLMARQSRFARPRARDIGVAEHIDANMAAAGIATIGALTYEAVRKRDVGLACVVLCFIDEVDMRRNIVPYIGGEQRICTLHDIVAEEVERYRSERPH